MKVIFAVVAASLALALGACNMTGGMDKNPDSIQNRQDGSKSGDGQ